MPGIQPPDLAELATWPVELLRIAGPEEVERLSSLDWDTFARNHPELVVHLSRRRVGARVGHALMLAKGGRRASGAVHP
jgi:hypothetical protein